MRNSFSQRGFTLIEMMVAVSIFAIVMLIGVGALFSLVQANERAQAINSVMNNLNAALEDMSRSIRVGTSYHCETSAIPPFPLSLLNSPQDCSSGGGLLLAFEPSGAGSSDPREVYRLDVTQLERSLDGGSTWVAMTAPEVTITRFSFYVTGSTAGDTTQPRVLMTIQGTAKVPGGVTTFSVQASVVQRILDI